MNQKDAKKMTGNKLSAIEMKALNLRTKIAAGAQCGGWWCRVADADGGR